MQFPITIGLHRSRFLAGFWIFAHGLALAVLFLAPWDPPLVLGAAVILLVMMAWSRPRLAVIGLQLQGDGRLSVRLPGEEGFVSVALGDRLTVHPWLVLLLVDHGGRRLRQAIVPDMLAADEFRRLRVWLRWRAKTGGGEA